MIDYDLTKIKAVMFDVDGVLSSETVLLSPDGEPLRTANIKDGYAIQLACKQGVHVAIVTGGTTNAVRIRYEGLGVEDVRMGCGRKINVYEELKAKYQLDDSEIIFVGDDIPDYEVLSKVGCACCPKDACSDIKSICRYVSGRNGGEGVGRDILEQLLRAKGLWLQNEKAFGW